MLWLIPEPRHRLLRIGRALAEYVWRFGRQWSYVWCIASDGCNTRIRRRAGRVIRLEAAGFHRQQWE